jgi:UDP-N-acetylglucosamine 1-carboxyvinyltransferase
MDVRTMTRLLETLGAGVDFSAGTLRIDCTGPLHPEARYELVRTMRASYYVLGPLLAREGKARVSLPGGCAIGARPIDLHLKGLRGLGAKIEIDHGYIDARAPQGLLGAELFLAGRHGSSVGATINVLFAAVLAKGTTLIEQAACEPEVVDTADFLRSMGARIEGAGTPHLRIDGVDELRPAEHRVIPDRIEAGTLCVAAIMTRGDVRVEACDPGQLGAVLSKLKSVGASLELGDRWVHIRSDGELKPLEIEVAPYPGFPTDMQAQMMSLATTIPGISVITETIFENRFLHVPELVRMGANITVEGNSAIVKGVGALAGAPVMASDLRASAALVLAGLIARGTTEVRRVYHLDRGYENLERKLAGVGAVIERVKEP